MNSEKKLEVLPQHVAGQHVVQVVRDRANLVQQYYEHDNFARDPALSNLKFIKFVTPPQTLPDGTQVPPVQRLITPVEARDLLSQDLARNLVNLRHAYDSYVARTSVPLPMPQVPVEPLLEVPGVGGEDLVQPEPPPEG